MKNIDKEKIKQIVYRYSIKGNQYMVIIFDKKDIKVLYLIDTQKIFIMLETFIFISQNLFKYLLTDVLNLHK